MKSTKKSLVLSTLSLMMCVAMLLGTTYAWFTDSVTSGKNIITAGNLDIEMYYADGTKAVPAADSSDWKDASNVAIFDYDLWEPGYTDVKHIMIANKGTLAFVYNLELKSEGSISKLANVLDVYVVQPTAETTDLQHMATQIATRADMSKMTKLCTLAELFTNGGALDVSGKMLAGETNTLTIAIKMQEEAGNEYQKLAVDGGFKVVLNAFQYTYEKDAFDDQYDKDAIPEAEPEEKAPEATVTTTTELKNAIASSTNDEIVLSVAGEVSLKDVNLGGKNVVLVGGEGGSLVDVGNGTMGAPGATVTMKNMKVKIAHNKTAPDGSGMTYTEGIQHAKQERYIGCTIEGQISTMTPDTYFENCIFNGECSDDYTFWIYNGKVVAKNCEFYTTSKNKGIIKLYAEKGNNIDLTLEGCKFHGDSSTSKGAIFACNTNNAHGDGSDYTGVCYKVVGTNCTFDEGLAVCLQGGTSGYTLDGKLNRLVLSDVTINGTSYKDNAYIETGKVIIAYYPETGTTQKFNG